MAHRVSQGVQLAGYRRDDVEVDPPYLHPDYVATRTRAPKRPLLLLPHTLTEVTGPVFGHERDRRARPRPDPPARRRAARRADHPPRPRARRRRAAGAQHAGGDLAGQRGGALPPRGRPPPGSARPELHRRRALHDRRRGALPLHHGQAGRVPVAQPPERVARRAHPLLAVRAGLRHAARHADVLPRRPALLPGPDLPLGARPQAPRADDLPVRPRRDRAGVGAGLQVRHRSCAGARPRRWRTEVASPPTPSQTVGPFFHIGRARGFDGPRAGRRATTPTRCCCSGRSPTARARR